MLKVLICNLKLTYGMSLVNIILILIGLIKKIKMEKKVAFKVFYVHALEKNKTNKVFKHKKLM
jgi:hypothetical protein